MSKHSMMYATARAEPLSTSHRNTAKIIVVMMTTSVVLRTSLARRPDHQLHFRAHFVKIFPRARRIAEQIFEPLGPCPRRLALRYPVVSCVVFNFSARVVDILASSASLSRGRSPPATLRHPAAGRTRNGRGGGIRTPTSGFGDRRSTVEPTPLNSRPPRIVPQPKGCADNGANTVNFQALLHFLVRRVLAARLAKLARLRAGRYASSGSS